MIQDPRSKIQDQPTLHVGIILDGNRRWAKARGLKTRDGHKAGAEAFKTIAMHAFDKGVTHLSAFVFSTENWQRAKDEVSFLMGLAVRAVELHLDEFHRRGIKIVAVGSSENVPSSVAQAIKRSEEKTMHNTRGTLALCFNYGGKAEIVDAVRAIVREGVPSEKINEALIDTYVYKPELPPVDLLIRTSGEHRTSGFMLWRADYAELVFDDKYWPDYTTKDFDRALADFFSRHRRFGQ